MREAALADEKADGVQQCTLTMLLMLRRGCNHPWMARAYWEAQERAANQREQQGLPANRQVPFDSPWSAKLQEVVKLVEQHPGIPHNPPNLPFRVSLQPLSVPLKQIAGGTVPEIAKEKQTP